MHGPSFNCSDLHRWHSCLIATITARLIGAFRLTTTRGQCLLLQMLLSPLLQSHPTAMATWAPHGRSGQEGDHIDGAYKWSWRPVTNAAPFYCNIQSDRQSLPLTASLPSLIPLLSEEETIASYGNLCVGSPAHKISLLPHTNTLFPDSRQMIVAIK